MGTKKTVLDDLLSNPYTLIAVDNGSAYSLYISDAETYEQNTSLPSDAKPVSSTSVITGLAGGDLTGSYPNPTVARIQSVPVSNTAPSNGQALVFDGSVWRPQTIVTPSGGGTPYRFVNRSLSQFDEIINPVDITLDDSQGYIVGSTQNGASNDNLIRIGKSGVPNAFTVGVIAGIRDNLYFQVGVYVRTPTDTYYVGRPSQLNSGLSSFVLATFPFSIISINGAYNSYLPYLPHFYRIDFNGSVVTFLFSPNGHLYIPIATVSASSILSYGIFYNVNNGTSNGYHSFIVC